MDPDRKRMKRTDIKESDRAHILLQIVIITWQLISFYKERNREGKDIEEKRREKIERE